MESPPLALGVGSNTPRPALSVERPGQPRQSEGLYDNHISRKCPTPEDHVPATALHPLPRWERARAKGRGILQVMRDEIPLSPGGEAMHLRNNTDIRDDL
jgi:hypothetical protein